MFIATRFRDQVNPLPSIVLFSSMALLHDHRYVYPVVKTMSSRPMQQVLFNRITSSIVFLQALLHNAQLRHLIYRGHDD